MEKIRLEEISEIILSQMETSGFQEKTRKFYAVLFHRLQRLAKRRGVEVPKAFLSELWV